jgi:hypothetical protein
MLQITVRGAIRHAADHIEQHPEEYCFSSRNQPEHPGCGRPGCALGWIAVFAGLRELASFSADCDSKQWSPEAVEKFLGCSERDFYSRMSAMHSKPENRDANCWTTHARTCARFLRQYADQYHPVEETQ